jgi:GT2 family glycosyltransferase
VREPLVSVVLPCHDAEEHLPEALESVLGQSHRRLEVVAVDDGSRDGTAALLAEAARNDARVRVLTHPGNQGIVAALNRGVAAARGDFVARMDADDVCLPERLARQLQLFRDHPGTDAVGTGVRLVDDAGRPLGERPPRACTPWGCRFLSYLATPLVHPSLLARAEVLRRHPYRLADETLHAEDYDLFARLARGGAVLRNVAAPLLGLRQSSRSVSRRFEEVQVERFTRCARGHLAAGLGLEPPPAVHAVLVNRMGRGTGGRELRAGLRLLDEVAGRFLPAPSPAEAAEVEAVAHQQRVDILLQAGRRGTPGLRLAALRAALGPPWSLLRPAGRRHLAGKRIR